MSLNINARVKHKHGTEASWTLLTDFVPMAGEIVIYDTDTANSTPRFKVGDGITTIVNLPFAPHALPDTGGNAATVNGFSVQRKTQAEYEALAVKDQNTLYIIID